MSTIFPWISSPNTVYTGTCYRLDSILPEIQVFKISVKCFLYKQMPERFRIPYMYTCLHSISLGFSFHVAKNCWWTDRLINKVITIYSIGLLILWWQAETNITHVFSCKYSPDLSENISVTAEESTFCCSDVLDVISRPHSVNYVSSQQFMSLCRLCFSCFAYLKKNKVKKIWYCLCDYILNISYYF